MKRHVDEEADALYLRIDDSAIVESEEVSPGVVLDYNEANQVAGIELLHLSKQFPNLYDVDVIGTQSKPISLSTLQRQVLDGLRRVETEEYRLGDWYLGALYALKNPYNPDGISQAAQSLRELLEKLPRAVPEMDDQGSPPPFKEMRRELHNRFSKDKECYNGEWKGKIINPDLDKTLGKLGEYLDQNQQPTRREQMQTAIAAFDPMVGQLDNRIRQAKRKELYKLWGKLEGFSHHKSKSDVKEFKQCLSTLERIVFDLLAPITAQDQNEIQEILKLSDRSDSDVERMLSLIERRGANFAFFFQHATDASWIPILKKRGYFAHPPKVEPIDDGRMGFPFWPQIHFLERISITDPCMVVDTILNFQGTDNPRILRTIAEIALKVESIEQSLRLKGLVSKYLQSPYNFGGSDLIPKLVNRWMGASTKATKAALNLIRRAVSFEALGAQDKQGFTRANLKGWTTSGGPLPRFGKWEYEQILEKGVRPLAEREPYRTARMLIEATATMINLQPRQDELKKVGGNDLSMIWCQRVDVSLRDYKNPDEALVHELTCACAKVYKKAAESVTALDQALRKKHWYIFTRIRQHLYALHPNEQTKPWIRELILTYADYDKRKYHFEFQRMIRLACEKLGPDLLSKSEKKQKFEAILSGPSKQDFRDRTGDRFSEERFEKRKRYFHRMQLRPFASVLFGKYRKYFKKLKAEEEQQITDDDYGPYRSEGFRFTEEHSPKPIEELKELSDEELLSFLNQWENPHYDPKEPWVYISFSGLSQEFQSIFKEEILPEESRLHFWVENRDRLERPIYVRTMLSAIHELVESKQFDKLDQWFDLCEWILSHPDQPMKEGVIRSDESRRHPDWQSARRAVGDFVGMCLTKKVNVPITARNGLASLVDELCTQYDSGLDDEEPGLQNQDDQFEEAYINTRSRVLEYLVDFGLWVRRHDGKADVPEIKAILEKKLSSEAKYPLTLPEYAMLGMLYRWIFSLDQKWAIARKSDFFPQNNLRAWPEAFGNFLRHSQPYRPIYNELCDNFEFSLEHLDCLKQQMNFWEKSAQDFLGHHLFTYYLWEIYPLQGDKSLLERYYQKTENDRRRWSTLFGYIGRGLRNTGKRIDSGFKDRIFAFFEWRMKVGEPSELQDFVYWLEADCLEAEWRLNAYSRILDLLRQRDVDHWTDQSAHISFNAIHSMREMLPMCTYGVVECFAKLVDSIHNSGVVYIHTDDAKAILKASLDHGDEIVREKAREARENLLRRGFLSVLDLDN